MKTPPTMVKGPPQSPAATARRLKMPKGSVEAIKKLLEKPKPSPAIDDLLTESFDESALRCGLHSGFPRCCIDFFIHDWSHRDRVSTQRHWDRMVAIPMYEKAGYIVCPTCIEAKRPPVRYKSCDCSERLDSALRKNSATRLEPKRFRALAAEAGISLSARSQQIRWLKTVVQHGREGSFRERKKFDEALEELVSLARRAL